MSLAQVQKALVALISAGALIAGFFITFSPGLEAALIAVTVEAFAVISVFLAKNTTVDDVSKTVQALTASVVGVVALFANVATTDTEKVISIVALLVPVVLVYLVPNRDE